jgi:hypothetical protein
LTKPAPVPLWLYPMAAALLAKGTADTTVAAQALGDDAAADAAGNADEAEASK